MEGNLKPLILNKAEFFSLFSPHSHIFSANFKLIFFFSNLFYRGRQTPVLIQKSGPC